MWIASETIGPSSFSQTSWTGAYSMHLWTWKFPNKIMSPLLRTAEFPERDLREENDKENDWCSRSNDLLHGSLKVVSEDYTSLELANSYFLSSSSTTTLYIYKTPIALTPDYGGTVVRYADGVVDLRLGHYVTVREDHRQSDTDPTTTIVSVELNGDEIKEPNVLVNGNDFYSFPRLTPDGRKMAWIEWSHPYMPWDKAELWVGYLSADGKVEKRVCIAGHDPNMIESPTEPKWSSQGSLVFQNSLLHYY
eukprot:Gb_22798 [translate_table: standard]